MSYQKISHQNSCFALLNLFEESRIPRVMTGSAYRELERKLGRTVKAFAATRQKLNGFERGCRDRAAAILGDIVRKRRQGEAAKSALVSKSAR